MMGNTLLQLVMLQKGAFNLPEKYTLETTRIYEWTEYINNYLTVASSALIFAKHESTLQDVHAHQIILVHVKSIFACYGSRRSLFDGLINMLSKF